MGRPDEHRAGREMLKDYRDGKMLGCRMPPPPEAEGRDAATAPVVYWVPTLAPRARNMGSRAEAAATSQVSSNLLLNKLDRICCHHAYVSCTCEWFRQSWGTQRY